MCDIYVYKHPTEGGDCWQRTRFGSWSPITHGIAGARVPEIPYVTSGIPVGTDKSNDLDHFAK